MAMYMVACKKKKISSLFHVEFIEMKILNLHKLSWFLWIN